jgi:hypothetical protein
MKNNVFFLATLLLFLFGAQSLKAQESITLTIELNAELDLNTQHTAPAMYDNIKAAIDAAFTALGNGETLANDGGRVTKVILKGSAPWSFYDLRAIRTIFAYGGYSKTPTQFTYQFNNLTEIDMSEARLVSDKIQSPLQWTAGSGKYTEYPYANIEAGAFAYVNNDNPKITTIIFPATMTSIGAKTFGRCKTLTNVTLPEGLISIGGDAFNSCSALTIPAGLPAGMASNLGAGAFNGCGNLELTVLPENLAIYGDASAAFMSCAKVVLTELPVKRNGTTDGSKDFIPKELFKNSGVAIKRIPEPATWKIYQVLENAFENCANIDTLIFPASFGSSNSRLQSKIGAKAFALPAESEVQRVYFFESEVPPLAGTAVDAFNKGAVIDPTAIVYVPNAAAVDAFKAVTPYDQMNVIKVINIVKLDGSGHGSISTDYGTVAADSTIAIRKGDNATFTIEADYGYAIDKVFANDEELQPNEEAANSYTFASAIADTDYIIRVEYTRNVFYITLNAGEHGTIATEYGTVNDNILDVNINDDVTFTFEANRGYEIAKVLVDDEEVELTEGAYTLTEVVADRAIAVEYARNLFYITLDAGEHGTIATEYGEITDNVLEVNKNDAVTFTFEANRGYEIAKVLVDDEEVELTEGAYTLTDVVADGAITVEYARNLFNITLDAGEHGTIATEYGEITDNVLEVNINDAVTFTFEANRGYEITRILVDNEEVALAETESTEGIYTVTLTDVVDDHAIAVEYQRNLFIISIVIETGDDSGSVTTEYGEIINNQIEVGRGDNVSFTLDPSDGAGFILTSLKIDGLAVDLPIEDNIYTLNDVTDDHTLEVRFGWPVGIDELNDAVVSRQYYNLQGIRIARPTDVFIVKTIHASGKHTITKQAFK